MFITRTPAYAHPCVFIFTHGLWFVSLLLKIQDAALSCFLMSRGAPLGGADQKLLALHLVRPVGREFRETAARKASGRSRPRGVLMGVEEGGRDQRGRWFFSLLFLNKDFCLISSFFIFFKFDDSEVISRVKDPPLFSGKAALGGGHWGRPGPLCPILA